MRKSILLVSMALFAVVAVVPSSASGAGWDVGSGERLVAQAGGILKVFANVKGAKVYLDDVEIGATPTIRLLPPGKYKVRVELAGYETYEEEITILPNKAVTINPELVKVVGSIEIAANVEGAEVYLQGRFVGKTPNAVVDDLPQGTYQIQVKKPGYATYSGPITIKPNVRLRLKVELTPNAGLVNVTSTPEGANVFLDDEFVGKTPLKLESVSAGRHALRIEMSGYATFYRGFQVSIGDRLDIEGELVRDGGALKVKTREEGADVYLDGSYLGKTPLVTDKTIKPGEYSLRISREHYADHIQPVVIERNRTTKVSAQLISLDMAMQTGPTTGPRQGGSSVTEKWWFWTTVGGVVAAAAGGTTYLVLSQSGGGPTGDIAVTLP